MATMTRPMTMAKDTALSRALSPVSTSPTHTLLSVVTAIATDTPRDITVVITL